MEIHNRIITGDAIDIIPLLPDLFYHTCVTSFPYYALRDYGLEPTKWPRIKYRLFGKIVIVKAMTCCLGLEPTPEAFIGHLVHLLRLLRPKLRDDGTLWLNMGDSYWGGKGKSGQSYSAEYQNTRYNAGRSFNGAHHQMGGKNQTRPVDGKHPHIKPKDMVGIPWMMAFALREDGWYLRQDIIWSKPNPMPESVLDRCTKSHEYVFLLSKSHKYYYDIDAIKEAAVGMEDANGFRGGSYTHDETFDNAAGGKRKKSGNKRRKTGAERGCPEDSTSNVCSSVPWEGNMRNKRDVWTVAVRAFPEAHFATFPEELIVDCIKAGCPVDGYVIDICMGSGTTAVVCDKLGRNWTGVEKSETYVNTIALPRLKKEAGLFHSTVEVAKPQNIILHNQQNLF